MATFSGLIVKFIPKSIRFRPLMIQINCVIFTKTSQKMHTLSSKQNMQIINLKWLTDCQILFKIKRVEAVDDIDKLCKFHENLTTNADCIA